MTATATSPAATSNEVIRSAMLHSQEGSSDKVYNVFLVKQGDAYLVNCQNGPRGGRLTPGTKTAAPVDLAKATKIYEKLVAEKMNGASHYRLIGGSDTGNAIVGAQTSEVKPREETSMRPMLPTVVGDDPKKLEGYLSNPRFYMQQKYDGEHVMVQGDGTSVLGAQKQGYSRPLPSHIEQAIQGKRCELAGELVGHRYFVFDALSVNGADLRGQPYAKRIAAAEGFVATLDCAYIETVQTAVHEHEKRAEFNRIKDAGLEGVVFKEWNAPYTPGETASVLKHKFLGESSVIVHEHTVGKRSVVSAAYVDGVYTVLGAVTIPPAEPLPPVNSVIEVKYLYANRASHALFQPVFHKVRTDQNPTDCRADKFKYKPDDVVEAELAEANDAFAAVAAAAPKATRRPRP